MCGDLFSYFVNSITAKWFSLIGATDEEGKSTAAKYAVAAASFFDSFLHKATHKKKPTRPTYN